MIWHSFLLMTLIDAVIILLTFVAFWNIYHHRKLLRRLHVYYGLALVLFGLICIASLYFADIVVMYVLPGFLGIRESMDVMKTLHLNYNWILSALGICIIVASLVYLNKIIFPKIMQLEDKLEKLALTDALTGAYNRTKLEEIMKRETERSRRYDTPLSIIIFDIDHFKKINDRYGHLAGDNVLKTISALAAKNIRETDYLIRWGGEEFMMILPETLLERAEVLSLRIQEEIEKNTFDRAGRVTVSFGVAQFKEAESEESFLQRADNALYQAKVKGRNRIEISS